MTDQTEPLIEEKAKSKTPLFVLLLLIMLFGALAVYFIGKKADNSSMNPSTDNLQNRANSSKNIDSSNTLGADTTRKITLDEIAKHNLPTDCWLAIEGNVYDVTKFIASGRHPGGDAILQGCGIDATVLFNTRPMGSGTPHSDRARSMLPNFKIGVLQ